MHGTDMQPEPAVNGSVSDIVLRDGQLTPFATGPAHEGGNL